MSADGLRSAKARLDTLVNDLKHRIVTKPAQPEDAQTSRLEARELQLKAARLEAKLSSIENGDARAGAAVDLDLRTLEVEIETLIPSPARRSR